MELSAKKCLLNSFLVSLLFLSAFALLFIPKGEAKKVEGLVLYLSFNEGTGKALKDLSENGNDGESFGAKWVDGKFGKALQFGGAASWITVPDNPMLDFGPKDSLTAECWVKVLGPPSGQGNFLAKYAVGAGTTPFYGMFHNVNNKVHCYIRDNGGVSVQPWSKDVVNDEKWHHLALIRDTKNKKVYFYVDGNQNEEMDDNTGDLSNDVPLAIGRHTGEFLVGIVDEAMVWRKALSKDEVKITMEKPEQIFAVFSKDKLATTWGKLKADVK